jgi:hypothetical protein
LEAVAQVARKRGLGPRHLAVALREIVGKYALPGIALVFEAEAATSCALPPAFGLPFEPIELDELHPALRALCGESEIGVKLLAEPPMRSTARRLASRFGVPALVGISCGIGVLLDSGDQVKSQLGLFLLGVLFGVALVTVWRWRSGRWFIFPGGVVTRRGLGGLSVGRAEHYSPQDSVLLIRRHTTGSDATICRGYRSVSRELAPLEAVALLGAWQSTVQRPGLEELFPP